MAKSRSKSLERIKNLLEKFSNAYGVSGYEKNIVNVLKEEMAPYTDEIRVDKLGNFIATKKGRGLSVMIAAHIDEVGFMVKFIDEKGFIYFVKHGGWFDQTLLNQRVLIHTRRGSIVGVVGSKPPHVMKEEERKKVIVIDDMYVDIGAKSRKDAERIGVEIGNPITLDRKFSVLANNFVTGKSFDNRAGVVVMIETARLLSKTKIKANVSFVGTVQEEVGLKGARTSAYSINPDVAVVIDTTIPGDHPGMEKKNSAIELGKGPAVTVSDAEGMGVIVSEQVLQWIKETAQKNRIPYQLSILEKGMTDAAIINLTRSGILTGGISVATRYLHSPVEVLKLEDIESCAKLTAECVKSAHKYF